MSPVSNPVVPLKDLADQLWTLISRTVSLLSHPEVTTDGLESMVSRAVQVLTVTVCICNLMAGRNCVTGSGTLFDYPNPFHSHVRWMVAVYVSGSVVLRQMDRLMVDLLADPPAASLL
jgi:hypothetical protein